MAQDDRFDYSVPFDIMCGRWAGITSVYDAKGDYQHAIPSVVSIYWKKIGSTMHYLQEEDSDFKGILLRHPLTKQLAQVIIHSFSLKITGKSCEATEVSHEQMTVTGAETRPGIYLFNLGFANGAYFNNQYFQSPNERHIIGPYLVPPPVTTKKTSNGMAQIGDVAAIVEQTFSRISYDVPPKFRRETP